MKNRILFLFWCVVTRFLRWVTRVIIRVAGSVTRRTDGGANYAMRRTALLYLAIINDRRR